MIRGEMLSRRIQFALLAAAFFFRFILDGVGLGIIGSLIIILSALLLALMQNSVFVSRRACVFIFISLIILVVSGFNVYARYETLNFFALEVIRFASYLAIYVLVKNGRIDFFQVYRLLMLLLLLQVPILIYQKFGLGIARPPGTLVNNNHLMYLVGFIVIIQLGLRAIPVSHFLLTLGLFVLLGGTGGFIFAGIVMWLHIAIAFVIDRKKKALSFQLVSIALVLSAVVLHWDKFEFAIRANTPELLTDRLDSGERYGGGTIGARIFFWHYFTTQVFSDPVSTAIGFGSGAATGRSTYFVGFESFTGARQDPHNEYVRIITDYGLIGLGAYLAFWISLFFGFLRNSFKRRSNCALLASSVVLFFLLGSIIANLFVQSTFMWPLIAMLALMTRLPTGEFRRFV